MAKRKTASAATAGDVSNVASPRWLVLTYEPVSLFSLRSTLSMSKGGKTLLVPSPYAIKMALIDAVFRSGTPDDAERLARTMFDRLKARRIRLRPPAECVVQNTFVKIRQEERGGDAGQYVPTIAYREMVYFQGVLEIALDARGWTDGDVAAVSETAMHVNYFGKRGSFFQFQNALVNDQPLDGFTLAAGDSPVVVQLLILFHVVDKSQTIAQRRGH